MWWITGGLLSFAIQILTMSHGILYKDNKQEGIRQSFTHQKFVMRNSLSFPPPKICAIHYF